MRIKVVKKGDLYSAEVWKDDGAVLWQSPRPMPTNELWLALTAVGCQPDEIVSAFRGVPRPSSYYHFAAEMLTQIEEALAEKREVPPQRPFVEAWIAIALLCEPSEAPLGDVVEQADAINVLVPTADEISWAFLQLRKRGWLITAEDRYGLTPQGRRTIEGIVGDMPALESAERLEQ
jgi:hypothetical protein